MTVRWPITIFCADVAHLRQGETQPRRTEVGAILYIEDRWWPKPHGRGGQPTALADGALADIDEDRWRFACRLCRMTVPARDDKVQRAFESLANHGVSEISLRGLATMLGKQ